VLLLAAFAVLGVAARSGPLGVDRWAARTVAGWRSPNLTGAVRAVNAVLAPAAAWVALGLLLAVVAVLAVRRLWRRCGAVLAWALVFVAVWRGVNGVKMLVGRPRPPSSGWLDAVSGSSYPSGHVAAVAAVSALAVAAAVRLGRWRWPVLAAGALLTAVTCLDRVYLGVHYLTDVVGSVLGVAGAALVAAAVSCRTRG
jgi:undecaprenyl-diphosphatase